MTADSLIPSLFGVTLIIVLAYGIYQFLRVRRSQQRSGQKPGEVLATKHPTRDETAAPRPDGFSGSEARPAASPAGATPSPARPPSRP
jgi:hypothetical protein